MFFLVYVFSEVVSGEKVASSGQSLDVPLGVVSRGAFESSSHWLEDSLLFILDCVFDSMDGEHKLSQIVGLFGEVYVVPFDVCVKSLKVG